MSSGDAERRYPDLLLLPQHEELLAKSGISPEVATARGYTSAKDPRDLKIFGFSDAQRRAPALVIPVWSVTTGKVATYQARPDTPRTDAQGKPVKYETPHGARMVLDCHPIARGWLADAGRPLFITEGIRKADAAVSRGLCCVALLGVWNWRGKNEKGGFTALADWESVALKDRQAYVAYDSDVMLNPQVHAALARLKTFLESRGARVALIYLPPGKGGTKVGLDDYFAAGHTVEDTIALATPNIRIATSSKDSTRRSIVVGGRHLRDVSADALRALDEENAPPVLFVRAANLVRVCRTERGAAIINLVGEGELRGLLARVADFVGSDGQPVPPPLTVVRDILALGEWRFPPLEAVVEAPVFRSDGSVLDVPGYDPATRLLYVPANGAEAPVVPISPMQAHIDAAMAVIEETIGEFPFIDEPSAANALALLLTLPLRPAIDGPVPLALIDKPAPGTGASLFADVVAYVTTGHRAAMAGAPKDEEEWRKMITATLMHGAAVVVIDNVDVPLASGSLSRAITAGEWRDRILGRSEMVTLPHRAAWVATGNNLRLRGDLARRSYWIRMNAQVAQPWRRTQFRHSDLLGWVAPHRGEILGALLTLGRAWFAAGQPRADVPPLGGFEAWSRVLGGVLSVAGVPGFLGNLDSLYELVDEDSPQWAAFLTEWHRTLGEEAATIADVLAAVENHQALRNAVPEELADLSGEGKKVRQRWGIALRKRADTVYGEGKDALRLQRVSGDRHAKVAHCKVCGDREDLRDLSRSFAFWGRGHNGNKQEENERGVVELPQVPALPATAPAPVDLVAHARQVFEADVIEVRPAPSTGGPEPHEKHHHAETDTEGEQA